VNEIRFKMKITAEEKDINRHLVEVSVTSVTIISTFAIVLMMTSAVNMPFRLFL